MKTDKGRKTKQIKKEKIQAAEKRREERTKAWQTKDPHNNFLRQSIPCFLYSV